MGRDPGSALLGCRSQRGFTGLTLMLMVLPVTFLRATKALHGDDWNNEKMDKGCSGVTPSAALCHHFKLQDMRVCGELFLTLDCHGAAKRMFLRNVITVPTASVCHSTTAEAILEHEPNTHTSACYTVQDIDKCHGRRNCYVIESNNSRRACSSDEAHELRIMFRCLSRARQRDWKSSTGRKVGDGCTVNRLFSHCPPLSVAVRDKRRVELADDVTPSPQSPTLRSRGRGGGRNRSRTTAATFAPSTTPSSADDDVTATEAEERKVMEEAVGEDGTDQTTTASLSRLTKASVLEHAASTSTASTTILSTRARANVVAAAAVTLSSSSSVVEVTWLENDTRNKEKIKDEIVMEWLRTAWFLRGHVETLILYALLCVSFGIICLLLLVIIYTRCCCTTSPSSSADDHITSVHRSSFPSMSETTTTTVKGGSGSGSPLTPSPASPTGTRSRRDGSPVWACDDDTGARLAKSAVQLPSNGWTQPDVDSNGGPLPAGNERDPAEAVHRPTDGAGIWSSTVTGGQSATLGRPYSNPYRHDSYRVDGMRTLQLK